ncbi:MAG TPA: SUF system NifU family Fe-S cluster assembly protein [Vicinamibacterales bacterium]|jgi:nitrogen fixation NifU-like protein|nr:SUF system NifU family Fe-S cluster assembly protein [Vicinamibacterales bacterium]
MSDLTDLYQEVILDHNRRPRNWGPLTDATRVAKGHNPLCGDRLTLYVKVEGGTLTGISFEGSGCAISKASASLMTDAVKGQSLTDALSLFDRVHDMLTTPIAEPVNTDEVGKMAVLSGVREFPARVKCASLAWHTLKSAILDTHQTAKTE